jgi:hypothetical protein
VVQSKCLRIATNTPRYVRIMQIHQDLGIPFFAVHIKAMTGSSDSNLADAGNPSARQVGRPLCRPRADPCPPGNRGEPTLRRSAEAVPQMTAKSAQPVSNCLAALTEVSVLFISCTSNARVKIKRGTARLAQSKQNDKLPDGII